MSEIFGEKMDFRNCLSESLVGLVLLVKTSKITKFFERNVLSQTEKHNANSESSAISDQKIINQKLTRVTDLKTVLTAILSLTDSKSKENSENSRQGYRMRYFIPATEIKGEPRYLKKDFSEKLDNIEQTLKNQLEVVKSGGTLAGNFSVEEASIGSRLDAWHEKLFKQRFVKLMFKRKEMMNETVLGLILNEYRVVFLQFRF